MSTFKHRQPLPSLLASLLTATLVACGGGGDGDGAGSPGPGLRAQGGGNAAFDSATLASTLASYPLQPPSTAEAEGLAFMREEEELAHAVYAAHAMRWPTLPIFGNIAASETTHTTAVKALLDRYQLADPLAGLSPGAFKTPALQALYSQLVAAGSTSLVDALKVGVQIEELDIHDLQSRIAEVDNADILLVYDNLLRGSRNHLRSYMRNLTNQGGSYTPQYLSQAAFDAIVQSAMEPGR